MADPGQIGVVIQSGGFRLLGTLFLAPGAEPKPSVILLHGMPGIEKNYDLALALRRRGWNSLIFHYRGCWGSEGVFTFKTIPDDITAALDLLCGGAYPGIDPARVVLYGHSLGGWAAVLTAAGDPRVRAVAAAAAIADPARFHIDLRAAAERFCPWLPRLSPENFLAQWQQLGEEHTPTCQVARLAPRPLLILHGANDELVPLAHSEALYACAGQPRRLRVHPTASHGFTWHRLWLQRVLVAWLEGIF